MSQYRNKIKTFLQVITKSIKQIPQDKQALIASRVNKVLQKYTNQQNDQILLKFQKQLEFNMNFIKLSYPNINFDLEQPSKSQPIVEPEPEHQVNINVNEKPKSLQEQFGLQNQQALRKQMKNISGVRQEVEFTNWAEGNVDPENFKKHKELLTRQHFGGDFWKGKEKPKMKAAQTVASFLSNPNIQAPKINQKTLQKKQKIFTQDPASMFEQVKR